MIPLMCGLDYVLRFYEELSVPTPHSRNAHFFMTRLYKNRQKPKFRQCYFLGNIQNIKTDILGHILVPVSEGPGEGAMYLDIAAVLFLHFCHYKTLFHFHLLLHDSVLFSTILSFFFYLPLLVVIVLFFSRFLSHFKQVHLTALVCNMVCIFIKKVEEAQ